MLEANVVVTIDTQGRVDRQIPWRSEDSLARLASGAYLIERRALSDGRCYFAILESPHGAPERRLSARQASVLALSARGLSAKAAASESGISQSHFSRELAEVASKVGCSNRTEVVWLASVLARSHGSSGDRLARLTPAERDVLRLAQRGLSNAAIAETRDTTESTVANQISSILLKTRLPTRRSLATLVESIDNQ